MTFKTSTTSFGIISIISKECMSEKMVDFLPFPYTLTGMILTVPRGLWPPQQQPPRRRTSRTRTQTWPPTRRSSPTTRSGKAFRCHSDGMAERRGSKGTKGGETKEAALGVSWVRGSTVVLPSC